MGQQTHVMLKLLLLRINMISAIGIGAENTPLMKQFHQHLQHFLSTSGQHCTTQTNTNP